VFFTSVSFLTYSSKNICYLHPIRTGGGNKKRGTPELGWLSLGSVKSKLKLEDGDFAETFGAVAAGEFRKAFY